MLEGDFRKVGVELLGEYLGDRRVDALPHFHLWHDQRRVAAFVDANEGIGRELVRVVVGGCSGSLMRRPAAADGRQARNPPAKPPCDERAT